MSLKRWQKNSLRRQSKKRRSQTSVKQTEQAYESLEPKQLLATVSTMEIVEYDLTTGVETTYSMPISESGEESGGVIGFEVEQDSRQFEVPEGFISATGLDQESVFGNDDRVFIADPHVDPYHEAGALRMQFSDGTWSFCSGTMVNEYHFLTAGHCVHDGDWINTGTVSLGRDGDDRWYGSANVTNIVSVTGWTQNADPDDDWAMIRLDRTLGNNVGWEGRWWWSSNGPLTGLDVSIAGYPGDLAGNTSQAARAADEHVVWQYESTGALLSPTSEQLRYNGTLDTAGGMSGSGVIEDRSGTGRLVVGVHAYGDGGDGTNEATRMTEGMSNIITDYTTGGNWSAPTDRADLTDWDAWFNNKSGDSQVSSMSTSSVRPGDSFSVTTFPRNNGTLSTGSYDVSFYASTNTIISSGDYFLGTVSMGNLGEFAWDTATLNIDFPEDIPEGTYNVGWIVDSGSDVTEFLENNNTNYITGSQLTVTQPLPLNWNSGVEGQAFFANTTNATNAAAVRDTLSFDANLNFTGDVESYYFTVETSGMYSISAGDFGNAVDPVLAVYDATTGDRIGFDDDAGPDDDALLDLNLSLWTPYIVAVGDWTETVQGDVNINIEGTTAWSSPAINLDGNGDGQASGLLNVNEDTDHFSFTTPANVGDGGTVTLSPLAGSGLDGYLSLFDSNDNLVALRNSAGADGDEVINLSGLVPGETYRVGIQSNDYLTMGDFTISVNLETVINEPDGIDFGPVGSPVWPGYELVTDQGYAANIGYGWSSANGLVALEESRGNDLIRDKVNLRNGTFVIDVDNGTYDVDIFLGVVKKTDAQRITIEGVADTFTPAAGPNVIKSYQVAVNDGQLTIEFDGLSGLNNRMNVSGIGLSEVSSRSFHGGGGSDDFSYLDPMSVASRIPLGSDSGDSNDAEMIDNVFGGELLSEDNSLAGSITLSDNLENHWVSQSGTEGTSGLDVDSLLDLTSELLV